MSFQVQQTSRGVFDWKSLGFISFRSWFPPQPSASRSLKYPWPSTRYQCRFMMTQSLVKARVERTFASSCLLGCFSLILKAYLPAPSPVHRAGTFHYRPSDQFVYLHSHRVHEVICECSHIPSERRWAFKMNAKSFGSATIPSNLLQRQLCISGKNKVRNLMKLNILR